MQPILDRMQSNGEMPSGMPEMYGGMKEQPIDEENIEEID